MYRTTPKEDITRLKLLLENIGFKSGISKLRDPCLPGSNVIMLTDLEQPLVVTMSGLEFLHMQKILSDAANVLWVPCGGHPGDSIGPEYAMTLGLLRSLQSEQASLKATFIEFLPQYCFRGIYFANDVFSDRSL